MTEEEWMTSTNDANKMYWPLDHRNRFPASQWKTRLFVIACGHLLYHLMENQLFRSGLEVAERFIEGLATTEELADAHARTIEERADDTEECLFEGLYIAENATSSPAEFDCKLMAEQSAISGSLSIASNTYPFGWNPTEPPTGDGLMTAGPIVPLWKAVKEEHEWRQVTMLRDIFGPLLFRQVTIDPKWRNSTAVSIAEGIYQDRAFDRMPIFADALEEAGCTNEEILLHCRRPGEHVRGCWVVDLFLGKE